METSSNKYVMSNDMALGFFDADGSVLLESEKATHESVNSISYSVNYFLGQSLSKTDAVEKFAEKFGVQTKVRITAAAAEFKVNQSSPEGQEVRKFLRENEPKNLYRLRDFYISEEMIVLLNKDKKSRVELVTLAQLVVNKSRLKNQSDDGSSYFEGLCKHINATAEEIKQGLQTANKIIEKVEAKLEAKKQELFTTKLSDDYILGAHFGDGSLYVGLTWKPPGTGAKQRLRCEPEWAISGNTEDYCQLFVRNLGGRTVPVDPQGQRKFVCGGIKKCAETAFPIFENASWMPQYKQDQFNRWKEAINLLLAQEHFTREGIERLLELTYDLAEKGERQYTKEQYLEWALIWLNDPTRQKRTPRGGEAADPNQ